MAEVLAGPAEPSGQWVQVVNVNSVLCKLQSRITPYEHI